MDNKSNKEPIRLDPEKFGIVPNVGGTFEMNQRVNQAYLNVSGVDSSRPVWLSLTSIFISLVCLILPGSFFFYFGLGVSLDLNISGILPLALGFVMLVGGIKLFYSNIKSILKHEKR